MNPMTHGLRSLESFFPEFGVIAGDLMYFSVIGASIMLGAMLLLDGTQSVLRSIRSRYRVRTRSRTLTLPLRARHATAARLAPEPGSFRT